MTLHEQHYFALLRAALWNEPVDIEGAIDWETVMQLAQHQANAVLLSDVASRMTGSNRPSAEMLEQMRALMRNNLLIQMSRKQLLVAAVTLLREHGIEPVVLKGFGLAALYPNSVLRQFGDIDLYAAPGDFHQACALLRTLPGAYTWEQVEGAGHHYNIDFDDIPLEVHHVSADVIDDKERAAYSAIERDGLVEHPQRVDIGGIVVSVGSKEFQVFFTFFHAWHHFLTSGVGWRQISDVAIALHAYNGQLDLEKLHGWMDAMHLMKPWQTFGCLMVDCLGLPESEMPFFDASCRPKAKRLLRRIMKEGNFRRANRFIRRKPKRRFWHKFHALVCMFVEFFHRVSLFPASAFREFHQSLRYAFKKNFPKK